MSDVRTNAETTPAGLSSLRFVRHRLERVLSEAPDQAARLTAVAATLTTTADTQCIAWVAGPGTPAAGLTCPVDGLAAPVLAAIRQTADEAIRSALTHTARPVRTHGLATIAAPVRAIDGIGALIVVAESPGLSDTVATVEVAAACLSAAEFEADARSSNRDADDAASLVDCLARVEGKDDLTAAATAMCAELRELFGCEDVFVGITPENGQLPVYAARAVSAPVDHDTQLALEAAMCESLMRATAVRWPTALGESRHALLGHRQAAAHLNCESLITTPLRTPDGHAIGSVLLMGGQDQSGSDRVLRFLTAAEPRLATSLALMQRSERRGAERLIARIRRLKSDRMARPIAAAMLAVALLLCLPLHYNVDARCEVQPLDHRYIAAPFDGPLQECVIRPGDMVEEGQLLARIDGRELRMTLAEVASNRNRAEKERDMYRAKREYASAEMARLEMEALQARRELLEFRGRNLEIRSPATGVVVSGDWTRSQGVPLETGETMFEIAPLNRMRVEIGIPEDDIAYVAVGQPVEIRLDARAGTTWNGRLLRVHPAAETRDGRHVFVGEVELENTDTQLRPGMRGRVSIRTSRHTLGWNLFHKPWHRFVAWLRYAI